MSTELILVGGGARSGKSRFALERALRSGVKRAFVATATPFDDEMQARIALHQQERENSFDTIEAPINLVSAASQSSQYDVVVLDCLTVYLSNLLLDVPNLEQMSMPELRRVEAECSNHVHAGLRALGERCKTLIVVTNEVGQGVVPVSRLGRIFRDVAGRINQSVAASATEVWFCTFGLPMRLKPSLSGQNPIDSTP